MLKVSVLDFLIVFLDMSHAMKFLDAQSPDMLEKVILDQWAKMQRLEADYEELKGKYTRLRTLVGQTSDGGNEPKRPRTCNANEPSHPTNVAATAVNDESEMTTAGRAQPIANEMRSDLEGCYYPKLLSDDLRIRVEDFLRTIQPKIVKFGQFKVDLVSRPKFVWGITNADGEYPLYLFGQCKESYSLMEPMTPILHEVANLLEERFGHERGFLNIAMATYYWNGTEHHIVPHQDKAVSKESKGKVEHCAPIYNISFGTVRPFTITTLDLISVWKGSKGAVDITPYVLKSIPMQPGDLVRLSPLLNMKTAHMVPKDPSIKDLRISLVFRHCDKRWVKLNEYHYDMVRRGRGSQKKWVKGERIPIVAPLAEAELETDAADLEADILGDEDDGKDGVAPLE